MPLFVCLLGLGDQHLDQGQWSSLFHSDNPFGILRLVRWIHPFECHAMPAKASPLTLGQGLLLACAHANTSTVKYGGPAPHTS